MRHTIEITLKAARVKRVEVGLYDVKLVTSAGIIHGVLHHREGNTAAVVLVGGSGGGFDGPAGIYPDIGRDLREHGVSSLRLDYRKANYLEDCVLDVLVAVEYLKSMDIVRVGLVGWSFGGAVVIEAGAESDVVQTVVTVASQTHGAGRVGELSPKPILLLHGTSDRTLPPSCSEDLYHRAREPKELVLYEHSNHGIDQKRGEMLAKIEEFLIEHLSEEE